MPNNRELVPDHQPIECAVCGRTMLKGERPEAFLVRDGGRRLVCELCRRRADQAGWIRESASPDMPAVAPRPERRQSLLARFRRREDAQPAANGAAHEHGSEEGDWAEVAEESQAETPGAGEPRPEHAGPRDPRHVRAVPTNQEVKIAHALDLFNRSEHARTVAGLCRTLGAPWVSALPIIGAPSEVSVVVAWELSWYQYRIDLSDVGDPVMLVAKGDEVGELDQALQSWNASAMSDGTLAAGVSAE
jgi:hypothetical protein